MYPVNERSPRAFAEALPPVARTSASLTYEPFYGLREKPFSLSADPRFLFRSPSHAPAFDELLSGIRRREGLIVLTGEIGTGKTTLCRSVLQHLDRRTFASFVADPFVSREDLLKTLLVDFGVISIGDLTRGRFNGATRSDLSYPLYEFLDSLVPLQAFAVVVIDEAQNLSLPLLEEIRILSELERREKLLQVVLVGQPELRSNLKLPQMRQVDQRVSVRCELNPLDVQGVAGYVNHRLKVAAHGESRAQFTAAALEAVYEGSAGVPRLINRICDRALQRASASQHLRVDAAIIREALEHLGLNPARTAGDEGPSREASPDGGLHAFGAEQPLEVPAAISVAAPGPQLETLPSVPVQPDAEQAVAPEAASALPAVTRSRMPVKLAAGALASLLAVSASTGAAAWYASDRLVQDEAVAALLPPAPAGMLARSGMPAPAAAADAAPLEPATGGAASAAAGGEYPILVASFANRARADRLVAELTAAGDRAGAAERDGGPSRGPLVLVTVGGYTSALEVQRDLQQIKALPGGYSDARIQTRE